MPSEGRRWMISLLWSQSSNESWMWSLASSRAPGV